MPAPDMMDLFSPAMRAGLRVWEALPAEVQALAGNSDLFLAPLPADGWGDWRDAVPAPVCALWAYLSQEARAAVALGAACHQAQLQLTRSELERLQWHMLRMRGVDPDAG